MTSRLTALDDMPEKHRVRRDQILAAAATTIAIRGYERVRLKDVAAECDVTTGMIQHYFSSREQVLIAAIERSVLHQVASWKGAAANEPDLARRLQIVLDHMLTEFSSREMCVIWTELCANSARLPQLRPLVAHVFDEWRSILRDVATLARDSGVIAPVLSIAEATNILVAAFDGYELSLAASTGTTPASAQHHIRLLAHVLFPPANADA